MIVILLRHKQTHEPEDLDPMGNVIRKQCYLSKKDSLILQPLAIHAKTEQRIQMKRNLSILFFEKR